LNLAPPADCCINRFDRGIEFWLNAEKAITLASPFCEHGRTQRISNGGG